MGCEQVLQGRAYSAQLVGSGKTVDGWPRVKARMDVGRCFSAVGCLFICKLVELPQINILRTY